MTTPEKPTEVRIRRAPKLSVFLVLGAFVGAIVTLFVTRIYPSDPSVGFPATFGYFLLYGVPAGVVLGAVVSLILDAFSRRRVRTVTVEREVVDSSRDDDAASGDASGDGRGE